MCRRHLQFAARAARHHKALEGPVADAKHLLVDDLRLRKARDGRHPRHHEGRRLSARRAAVRRCGEWRPTRGCLASDGEAREAEVACRCEAMPAEDEWCVARLPRVHQPAARQQLQRLKLTTADVTVVTASACAPPFSAALRSSARTDCGGTAAPRSGLRQSASEDSPLDPDGPLKPRQEDGQGGAHHQGAHQRRHRVRSSRSRCVRCRC